MGSIFLYSTAWFIMVVMVKITVLSRNGKSYILILVSNNAESARYGGTNQGRQARGESFTGKPGKCRVVLSTEPVS